jgi:hypothetical protein
MEFWRQAPPSHRSARPSMKAPGNLIRVFLIPFVEPISETLALGTLVWAADSLRDTELQP